MARCLLLVALLHVVFHCHARPNGAPKSACSSLTPVHSGFAPQESDPPYTVVAVKSGEKVAVTISSPIGEEFQGFVLQARSASDRTKFVNGEFKTSEDAQATDCFQGTKNTLTHREPTPKKDVVTVWTPGDGVNGDVVFRATILKTYNIFWTQVDSAAVKIGSVDSLPTTTKSSNPPSMYDSCFHSKGCFGLPSGCAQRGDCEVLLTYAKTPSGIRFDMMGHLDPSMYMAMGLSHDAVMGEDSVTECIREGSDVTLRESWNEGKSNTRTSELSRDQYLSSFINGLSHCSWMKADIFESNGQQYDLANKSYYVLLAKGEVANGRLKYHDGRIPSSGPVNFTAFEAIEAEGVTTSVKIHGVSDENTETRYTSTVSVTTEEHEVKSTSTSNRKDDKNAASCSSELNTALLLIVLLVFYIVKGNLNLRASSP